MANIQKHKLKELLEICKDVDGDTMEIGVLYGDTFKMLAPFSADMGKKAFALDSFCGMDEAGEFDGSRYPKGRLSVGGVDRFKKILSSHSVKENTYECFEGYIPVCFEKFDEEYPDKKLSFVLLDVDHYEPTVKALAWFWEKIPSGGILVLDDYFKNKGLLASKAIDEWLPQKKDEMEVLELNNTQLFIKKIKK